MYGENNMKIYNPKLSSGLHFEIENLLNKYRKMRNFNPSSYIEQKTSLLNSYMKKFGLKSCVVAVSGGIDSALVLALVQEAQLKAFSPIEKIVAVSLPVMKTEGATGQQEAMDRAKELCEKIGVPFNSVQLEEPFKVMNGLVSRSLNIESGNWALGQLVAHMRTPALYYTATLLTQENLPAIIVGTTNRDEGLYIGYFGKASDGLVDLQLISDLHKSEVYACSELLGVPESILNVSPQGDMYDGRIDEEVFGASYDFLEYYQHYMSLSSYLQDDILNSLSEEARENFTFFKNNLDNMHRYNRHKYFGASPAVHLDIDNLVIPEGWKTNCSFSLKKNKPVDFNKFVGLFNISSDRPETFKNERDITVDEHFVQNNSVKHLHGVLSEKECDWLLEQTINKNWLPANLYGNQKNFDEEKEKPMSHRLSIYDEALAYHLFNRIGHTFSSYKTFNEPYPLICNEKNLWVAKGINPYFRYIRYQKGQSLIPHYDDTYEYHENRKTLMTMVIYLDNSDAETRFIKDPLINSKNNSFDDWHVMAEDEDVVLKFKAVKGDVLLFDHRVLHDATAPSDKKHILRTDIIFEAPEFGFTFE